MTFRLTNHALQEMARRGQVSESLTKPLAIVTVYRTSRIEKYWRPG